MCEREYAAYMFSGNRFAPNLPANDMPYRSSFGAANTSSHCAAYWHFQLLTRTGA
jgi:hypothetical protein